MVGFQELPKSLVNLPRRKRKPRSLEEIREVLFGVFFLNLRLVVFCGYSDIDIVVQGVPLLRLKSTI
ncbi:hypothetical protein GQ457_06G015850 [Hibiscus cannabinus]